MSLRSSAPQDPVRRSGKFISVNFGLHRILSISAPLYLLVVMNVTNEHTTQVPYRSWGNSDGNKVLSIE